MDPSSDLELILPENFIWICKSFSRNVANRQKNEQTKKHSWSHDSLDVNPCHFMHCNIRFVFKYVTTWAA